MNSIGMNAVIFISPTLTRKRRNKELTGRESEDHLYLSHDDVIHQSVVSYLSYVSCLGDEFNKYAYECTTLQ